MKQKVLLSIRGVQSYADQEPDVIELVTEGTLEKLGNGWEILYEETKLTGMEGVTTSFLIEPDKIVLTRTGSLKSQMIFTLDKPHDSLYQMDFGALMITVCATKIHTDLSERGGTVDLDYRIEIEQNSAGMIEYHLDMRPL
ncbi:MAG: DUF1934 domain-containing protein [Oscillospiraceae bacterium]|nr:DUF1934 domain-containing protein [Oscillospiraceae bacterium]